MTGRVRFELVASRLASKLSSNEIMRTNKFRSLCNTSNSVSMILSNPLRQQTALRTSRASVLVRCTAFSGSSTQLTHIQTRCLYNPKSQRRRLHHVPKLTHDDHFSEHGVGNMLTASSYEYAWTEYQGYIVQRLNSMTAGMHLGLHSSLTAYRADRIRTQVRKIRPAQQRTS